jgi:hypothetical protein
MHITGKLKQSIQEEMLQLQAVEKGLLDVERACTSFSSGVSAVLS